MALLMILLRQFKITRISAIYQFLFSPCVENEQDAQFQCRCECFVIMRMISIDEFFLFWLEKWVVLFLFSFRSCSIIVWCALSPSISQFPLVQLSPRYSDR